MSLSIPTALEGFILGLSLIIPIGTQNMYVLRQGVAGSRAYISSLVCAVCDTFLIIIGVMGLGTFISAHPMLKLSAVIGGIIFLGFYAIKSFIRALSKEIGESAALATTNGSGVKVVILSSMALSLLNPHAILDTTVLIGGISSQYILFPEKVSFCFGTVLASWIWFFSLSYFSTFLKPLFKSCRAMKILDGIVGFMMVAIIIMLIKSELFSMVLL